MIHHPHTQPRSHTALGLDSCAHQVAAKMHRWDPCKSLGCCWVGKVDEVPAKTTLN